MGKEKVGSGVGEVTGNWRGNERLNKTGKR